MVRRRGLSRREILQTSALLVGAPRVGGTSVAAARSSSQPLDGGDEESYFGFNRVLSSSEALAAYSKARTGPPVPGRHLLFYWADDALLSPINVTPAYMRSEPRRLDIWLQAFNASSRNRVWRSIENDLQLEVTVHAQADQGRLSWILLSVVSVFLGENKEGCDDFFDIDSSELRPTSGLDAGTQVVVRDGRLDFQLQLSAQKKRGWWRRLFGFLDDVPAPFRTIAIPRLVTQGVAFAERALGAMQDDDDERLIEVLRASGVRFRISEDVQDELFTLRPGYWVAIDRGYAKEHMDRESRNLEGYALDRDTTYCVLDRERREVDADYLVFRLDFPAEG